MKIQTPPGMRDFYPEDMRLQNWLLDTWRSVSETFGFQPYEGPIFEYLDLYRLKSGDAIVSELFHFQDRGEREFAIRPEMTPTLARMVAARANALPRPIKWYSMPRMCRAERPQKGRLREFFQWNVDILGVEDPIADAEIIATAVAFFERIGLTKDDVVIRYSDRRTASACLSALGIADDQIEPAFELIDRLDRLPEEEVARRWKLIAKDAVAIERLREVLTIRDHTQIEQFIRDGGGTGISRGAMPTAVRVGMQAAGGTGDSSAGLTPCLENLGIANWCEFDLRIVRGLAYYTGVVFEAHPRNLQISALLGGGRYDDLTGLLGGPKVTGVGFGMGDSRILLALEELGRLPNLADTLDAFVIHAGPEHYAASVQVAQQLRATGLRADFSYKQQNIGKQFKQADARGARFAIIVGQEYDATVDPPANRQVAVKDLRTGEQEVRTVEEVIKSNA